MQQLYNQWVAEGGDGSWANFRQHVIAIGSPDPGPDPGSAGVSLGGGGAPAGPGGGGGGGGYGYPPGGGGYGYPGYAPGGAYGYIPGMDWMSWMGGMANSQWTAEYQKALLDLQRARYEAIELPNAETQRRAIEAEIRLGEARQRLAEEQAAAASQQFDVGTAMDLWRQQGQQAMQQGAGTGFYAPTAASPNLPYHYQRDQLVRDFQAQFGRDPTQEEVEQMLPQPASGGLSSSSKQAITAPTTGGGVTAQASTPGRGFASGVPTPYSQNRQLVYDPLTGQWGYRGINLRQQDLSEWQAQNLWKYQQAMMQANPANYALTAALQGQAPWQQGLASPQGDGRISIPGPEGAITPLQGGPTGGPGAGAQQPLDVRERGALGGSSGGGAARQSWQEGLTAPAQDQSQTLRQRWGVPVARKMTAQRYTRLRPDERAAFGSAIQATGQSQADYEEQVRRWAPRRQQTQATMWG